jgi:maltose/moltooligosaccharide transporter
MDGSRTTWVLDAGNNTAMEPYRAFIADTLEPAQQPTGFQAQSFFTGLGKLWQMFHYSFSVSFVGTTGNYQLGFCLLFLVLFVPLDLFGVLILPKIPPTEEELRKIKRGASRS